MTKAAVMGRRNQNLWTRIEVEGSQCPLLKWKFFSPLPSLGSGFYLLTKVIIPLLRKSYHLRLVLRKYAPRYPTASPTSRRLKQKLPSPFGR